MSPKLPSSKRSILLSLLFLAFLASAVYLQFGDEIRVPAELEIALSSIREDCDSWISWVAAYCSLSGHPNSGHILRSSSEAGGIVPSAREESDRKSDYVISDATSSPSSVSPILKFNSSLSTGLFRTWGTLTLEGGSTLPYLILNATLWDGNQLVESTRYMMMEVVPGESRNFDILEICRLSPERGYSCLLEVEEPEELFASERRDCMLVEEDPKVVIWDGSGAANDREAASEKGSICHRLRVLCQFSMLKVILLSIKL